MTTISAEREKEAQKYSEDMRDTFSQIVGDEYKIERAFVAGCENEARNPRWRNPLTSMPADGERVLVAVFRIGWPVSVRIMMASRKETTDFQSPIVFKSITDKETVIGWLPLPVFNVQNIKDYGE